MDKIILSILLIVLPAIIGYISGMICKVQDTSGSTVNSHV